jgi:hypothetical protein
VHVSLRGARGAFVPVQHRRERTVCNSRAPAALSGRP